MPDIVSRIRVEALGADQAAREIRKLAAAYKDVAQAGRNLSPSAGGADPFSAATSAPGGGVYGGQRAPADIVDRETRNKNYSDQARERENSNSVFNASMRKAPGAMGQGLSTVEAAATGRGGAAVGGLASGLGALLGGPAGIALLAGGALAMGIQKFADNAYERMEGVYGTGLSQRLGRSYQDIMTIQTAYGRTGIPMGMVQGFFQSAGASGFNMNRGGALGATNLMMEAMASLGVDPGVAGALLGGATRAGADLGRFGGDRGYGLIGQAARTFGRENVTMYLQEMSRGINELATRGIDIQEETITQQTNLLGALRQFGGMSPEGAIALNQQMMGRGIGAAQLQRPEDIIAFQAMRSAGMSVTDTMLAMEQRPGEVNRRVYEYLKGATGGQEDLLRLRMQEYMGGGTTMSQVVDFINTMEGLKGKTQEQVSAELGAGAGWIGRHKDEKGNWVYDDPAREITAARQSELLRGVEQSMLTLTTGLQETMRDIFLGPLDINALNITWKGYAPTLRDAMNAAIPIDQPGRSNLMDIRTDPRLTRDLVGLLQAAGIQTPYSRIEEATMMGGWRDAAHEIMSDMARGMMADTQRAAREGQEGVTKKGSMGELTEILRKFVDVEIANKEDFEKVLRQFIDEAQKRGYVLTDN